jgi:glycosyltransferase involved in cell wall biosynthesis
MPRVLRILNRFNLGGPTYNAAYLTKYMAPEYETLLIGGEKDESEETSLHIVNSLGIEPVIISQMKRSIDPSADLRSYSNIKKIIRDFKPDIVHTHAAKSGFIGRLAAYRCNVPVIVHTFHGHVFHSYFNTAKTTIFKNLERYAGRLSDGIIAISEKQKYELAEIHKICPASKIQVIPLGFDLKKFSENISEKRAAFRKEYLLDEDELAVGIIGRLVPVKNHDLFLRAVKSTLEKTTKKVRIFIVGDGEKRGDLQVLCSNLGLDFVDFTCERRKALVTFTSWLKEIDVVNAGMDIIALSSLNEGTPVSLIEAQASGKPIVSTAVGGIEDVIIPDKTALLSAKDSVEDFSNNLLRLIENDSQRTLMSGAGIDLVNKKFVVDRLVRDMSEYYSSLIQRKNYQLNK